MSNAAEKVSPIKEAERNVLTVYGKVNSVRKLRNNTTKEPFYISILSLPKQSDDEFGHPQTVEIFSDSELGKSGDVVTVRCSLGGFGRTYTQTDKETGEITKVRTADNRLHAI